MTLAVADTRQDPFEPTARLELLDDGYAWGEAVSGRLILVALGSPGADLADPHVLVLPPASVVEALTDRVDRALPVALIGSEAVAWSVAQRLYAGGWSRVFRLMPESENTPIN